ncbi:MAG: hypothetical protein HOV79_26785 [Hamadaea sp.]|nr:hypothetical protein [Hamadaea sp.]
METPKAGSLGRFRTQRDRYRVLLSLAAPAKPADRSHGALPIVAPLLVLVVTALIAGFWGAVLNVGADLLPRGVYDGVAEISQAGSTVMCVLLAAGVAAFVRRLAAAEPARSLPRAVAYAILPALVFWVLARVSVFEEIAIVTAGFALGLVVGAAQPRSDAD